MINEREIGEYVVKPWKGKKNREGMVSGERKLLFTKDWQQENGKIWKKERELETTTTTKSTFQDPNAKIGRSKDQQVMLKPLGERAGQQIIPLLPSYHPQIVVV